MRMSRKQVAENRKTILSAAARLFREKGFDAVSIGEIMGAAGLTHGGFYGYFENKEALIAEALENREAMKARGAAARQVILDRCDRDRIYPAKEEMLKGLL